MKGQGKLPRMVVWRAGWFQVQCEEPLLLEPPNWTKPIGFSDLIAFAWLVMSTKVAKLWRRKCR